MNLILTESKRMIREWRFWIVVIGSVLSSVALINVLEKFQLISVPLFLDSILTVWRMLTWPLRVILELISLPLWLSDILSLYLILLLISFRIQRAEKGMFDDIFQGSGHLFIAKGLSPLWVPTISEAFYEYYIGKPEPGMVGFDPKTSKRQRRVLRVRKAEEIFELLLLIPLISPIRREFDSNWALIFQLGIENDPDEDWEVAQEYTQRHAVRVKILRIISIFIPILVIALFAVRDAINQL